MLDEISMASMRPLWSVPGREFGVSRRSYRGSSEPTDQAGSGRDLHGAAHVVDMDTIATPVFLTPQQVAESLQISIRTLEDWRLRGYGPPFLPVGKHVRYPLIGFEAWVAAGTKGAA